MIRENESLGSDQILKKAKDYVYRILKFRMRSEAEVIQRLKLKKFDQFTIQKTVEFFKSIGLIDDLEFCQLWVEERLKKPLGISRIIWELRQKGIADKIIERVVSEKKILYQEEELIRELLQKKIKKIKSSLSLKDKRRLYNWFFQRGFDTEKVLDLINSL